MPVCAIIYFNRKIKLRAALAGILAVERFVCALLRRHMNSGLWGNHRKLPRPLTSGILLMKGIILINAYSDLKGPLHQAQRMEHELRGLGVETEILRNDAFFTAVDGTDIISRLPSADFCIYLDKDKYVSSMLEACGLRLFNRHNAIRLCDDKMLTHIALAGHGIPMPKTLPGLLCYRAQEKVKPRTLDIAEQELGYPIIVKECYGSLGSGVFMAKSRTELEAVAEKVKCKPHLFQRCIVPSLGHDLRVIVIGGKALACMLRQSETDFRSNAGLGGRGLPFEPQPQVFDICERASRVLGLDFCGVDVLLGEDDSPLLCEVNSNAFFEEIERVSGVNVAGIYAQHIVSSLDK